MTVSQRTWLWSMVVLAAVDDTEVSRFAAVVQLA